MLKIVIIDDEQLIIEGLRKTINNMNLDIKIVGEATNAYEAINMINEKSPDILLTDIVMPEMSGLDLIEKIKDREKELSIIIISGHGDFPLVKRALNNGVQDYLLKPIDTKELSRTLTKIIDVYKRNKRKQISDYQVKKIENLKRLINSETSQQANQENVNIPIKSYVVAVSYLFEIFEKTTGVIRLQNITNLIFESRASNANITIFENKIGEIVCIYDSQELQYENVIDSLDSACKKIKEEFGCHISFGVSRKQKNISDIRSCYEEAIINHDLRIYDAKAFVFKP